MASEEQSLVDPPRQVTALSDLDLAVSINVVKLDLDTLPRVCCTHIEPFLSVPRYLSCVRYRQPRVQDVCRKWTSSYRAADACIVSLGFSASPAETFI